MHLFYFNMSDDNICILKRINKYGEMTKSYSSPKMSDKVREI